MEKLSKRKLFLTVLSAICFATVLTALLLFITPSGLARADEEVKENVKIENELEEKEKPEKEKASETKSINMNSLPVLSEEEFTEKCTCPQIGDCLKDKYLVIRIAHFVNDDFYQVAIEMQNGYISFQGPVGLEDEIDFYFCYVSKSTVAFEKNYVIYDNDLCLYFQFSSNSSSEPDYTLNSAYENLYYSDSPLLFDEYVVQSTPNEPTTPSSGNEPSGNNGSTNSYNTVGADDSEIFSSGKILSVVGLFVLAGIVVGLLVLPKKKQKIKKNKK